MELHYQASALQDRFVTHLLNFKRNGFYLDIGSCHSESCNNTYCFEGLDWAGICIEKDAAHNESYKKRNCVFLNEDALKIDYTTLLSNYPKTIDYLSLDIDELSTIVLHMLPFDKHDFSVITIEHDHYIHGDIYRAEQRAILSEKYNLVCADVLVPLSSDTRPNCSFEDWYVHKSIPVPEHLYSAGLYPEQILAKFK